MANYDTPLLTRKQAARYLHLGQSTFDRLVRDHEIMTVRMGGTLRFKKTDLDDYINRCNRVGFVCTITM